eukprot:4526742-Prymnesium_polylepis.1
MPLTLPECVFARARDDPSRTAIEVWDERRGITLRTSFRDLALAIAAAVPILKGKELGSGSLFGMWAHNSVAYVAVSLGGMALGAVSVNVNWRMQEETNFKLLESLDVTLLLHDGPFRRAARSAERRIPRLKVLQIEAFCRTPLSDTLPFSAPAFGQPEDLLAEVVAAEALLDPNRVAAVFFTSGTTGTPKAVPHTHRGLMWVGQKFADQYPAAFKKEGGTVCFTPFFHVMGFVANLCFNLVAGVRAAILASHEAKIHPQLLLDACSALKPTVINTVSLLRRSSHPHSRPHPCPPLAALPL